MDRGTGPSRGQPAMATSDASARVSDYGQSTVSEQPTVRVAVAAPPSTATDKKLHDSRPSTSASTKFARATLVKQLLLAVQIAAGMLQTLLLVISFVPASFSVRLGWSSADGPFPTSTAPLVTVVFYLLPFVMGVLARRWEAAVFGATSPAWLAIFVYLVGTSSHNGIFDFIKNAQPSYLVGTLELFAALGFFGWLTRRTFFDESAKH